MNVTLLPRTLVFGICLVVSTVSAAPFQLRVVGPASKMAGSSLVWHGWLLVSSDAERAERVTPQVEADGARVLDVFPASAEVAAQRSALFAITLAIDGTIPGQLQVTLREYPKLHAIYPLRPVIDLSQLDWERWWAGAKSSLSGLREPPQAAVPWKPLRLPKLWQELGVTWVRSRVQLPAAWRGRTLQLDIAAVDDCDATFFNGRVIGKTNGWDTPRKYRIPADLVRWDQANEICIAVDNINAGGGIYRLPLELRPADIPASVSANSILTDSVAQDERQRQRPKPLGAPLPLRPLRVEEWRLGEVPFPSVAIDPTTIIDLFATAPTGENLNHFALVIGPIDLHELRDSGEYDVVEGPATRWGAQGYGTSLYIRDPDDNVVELRTYPSA